MAHFRPAARRYRSSLIALAAVAVALSAAPKAQALSLYWYGGDHDLWTDQNWTGGVGGYYEDLTFAADYDEELAIERRMNQAAGG